MEHCRFKEAATISILVVLRTFIEIVLFSFSVSTKHFAVVRRKDDESILGVIAEGGHQGTNFLINLFDQSV